MKTQDTTSRFRVPAKRAAYESALAIIHKLEDIEATHVFGNTVVWVRRHHPVCLSTAAQVTAKALRVERGRRIAAKQKEQAQ